MNFLDQHLEKKDNILLKGSRSMRMEEILTLWKRND
jgi:UDP-N-acetylmuramyl pentapeptide synthase